MSSSKTNKNIEKAKKFQMSKEIWQTMLFLPKYAEEYRRRCFTVLIVQWIFCILFVLIFIFFLIFILIKIYAMHENIEWSYYYISAPVAFGICNSCLYFNMRIWTTSNKDRYFAISYLLGFFTLNILPLIHCSLLYKRLKKIASEQQQSSIENDTLIS